MNSFLSRWFLFTNHKDIGTLYFIFGTFAGVVGTLSLLFILLLFIFLVSISLLSIPLISISLLFIPLLSIPLLSIPLLSIPLELAYVEYSTSNTAFLFNEVLKDENMYVLTCIVLFAISFVLLAIFHYKMTNLKVLNTNLQKKTADLQTQVSFLQESLQNLKTNISVQENQLKDLATVCHDLEKNIKNHHQDSKVNFQQQISNLTRPSVPRVKMQFLHANDRQFLMKVASFWPFLFLFVSFVSVGLGFWQYFSLKQDIIFRAPGWLYVPENLNGYHVLFSWLVFSLLIFYLKHFLTEYIKKSNLWTGKKKNVALFTLNLMNLLLLPLIGPVLAICFAYIQKKEILFQSDFLGTFRRLLSQEERIQLHQEALKAFLEKINVSEDIQAALQHWITANLPIFLNKYTEGSVIAKDYLLTELEKQTTFLLSQISQEPTFWEQTGYSIGLPLFFGAVRYIIPLIGPMIDAVRSGEYQMEILETFIAADFTLLYHYDILNELLHMLDAKVQALLSSLASKIQGQTDFEEKNILPKVEDLFEEKNILSKAEDLFDSSQDKIEIFFEFFLTI